MFVYLQCLMNRGATKEEGEEKREKKFNYITCCCSLWMESLKLTHRTKIMEKNEEVKVKKADDFSLSEKRD